VGGERWQSLRGRRRCNDKARYIFFSSKRLAGGTNEDDVREGGHLPCTIRRLCVRRNDHVEPLKDLNPFSKRKHNYLTIIHGFHKISHEALTRKQRGDYPHAIILSVGRDFFCIALLYLNI
jgi:hypothetical protein